MKDMLNGVAEGESEDRSIKCDFLSRGLTCECFFISFTVSSVEDEVTIYAWSSSKASAMYRHEYIFLDDVCDCLHKVGIFFLLVKSPNSLIHLPIHTMPKYGQQLTMNVTNDGFLTKVNFSIRSPDADFAIFAGFSF